MALQLISDFTGTDENPLSEGGNWATLNSSSNPLKRLSNAVTSSVDFADNASYWTPANFGPDFEAYVTITISAGSPAVGIACRIQGEGGAATWDGYLVASSNTGIPSIRSVTNAVQSILVSGSAIFASGDKLGARLQGSTIQVWRQASGVSTWTQILAAVDATYTSAGKVGLYSSRIANAVDDFYVSAPLEYLFGGGVQQVPAVPFL